VDQLGEQYKEAHAHTNLKNYKIFNQNTFIGNVFDMEELPSQIMVYIDYEDKQVMIPLVTDFIIELNHKTKEIFMELPEGILDL
jgi:16S rRNA processing protein RimM